MSKVGTRLRAGQDLCNSPSPMFFAPVGGFPFVASCDSGLDERQSATMQMEPHGVIPLLDGKAVCPTGLIS